MRSSANGMVRFGVKLGSGKPFAESPFHPDERPLSDRADRSVSCQKQTCFSKPTKRKRLHAIARTFGLLGADR
jgi:hypothetical protein